MANPTPNRSDVCSRCGCTDSGFGGPRKLEWDHVGGEGNNEAVGWWLCTTGCHEIVTDLQRRDGDSWGKDPNREQSVKYAWLIHGAATRLGFFNRSFRSTEQADVDFNFLRRFVQKWLIAGTGNFDGDEGSYRRPGANPLANDISIAVAKRKKKEGIEPEVARSDRIDRSRLNNLFRAIFDVDQQLPGEPRIGIEPGRGPRAVRRLHRLASEGSLEFLLQHQDAVNDTVRQLADSEPGDHPPDGFHHLVGLVKAAEELVRVSANAENLDQARAEVDALTEQWSTNPTNQTRLTSN